LTRLLILTPGELTRDPRARRAADSARATGLDVVSASLAAPTDALALAGASRTFRHAELVGRWHLRPLERELRGLFRLLRLLHRTRTLVRNARRLLPVDIVHANDLDTLPAGWLLARRDHARLVYDAHELYSAQETDPPRLYRAVTLALERKLARRADALVTTGETFATEVTQRLRLARPPLIVLNAPELWPDPPKPPSDGPLRIAYQAAADHSGRPLDDLIAAATFVPEALWTVRIVRFDSAQRRRELMERGLSTRVAIEEPVAADHMRDGLIGHHAGLILQRPVTPNDGLAVPNKLFEYMMAGLAVIAPNLPGLVTIVEGEGVGVLYDAGDPASLAEAVRSLAADRPRLDGFRTRARELAVTRYNAEAERPTLRRAWGV
jgi:glycogen(starch) synthase